MLDDLWKRLSEVDSSSDILWFHGPAGAGKSAIAQSFCEKLEAADCLGASFFFKRGHPSRGTGNKLFPTIAYQLALCLPDLKQAISRVVEENPSIVDRGLSCQLQKLIIEPCQRIIRCPGRPLVIVIDGLDECDSQNIQQEILRSIGSAIHQGSRPLRFLVTSRPEPHIRDIFLDALHGMHRQVNIDQSFEDVRKFLLDQFSRIYRNHRETMAAVQFPWPTLDVVENLVEKSSGYFIYASTVIKFVDDKDFRPTERLEVILGIEEPDFGSPFATVDQLYTQILSQVPLRPQLLEILTCIAAKLKLTVGNIERLLELEPGDVRLALRGLQSVIGANSPNGSVDDWSFQSRIVVHHASFYDFLQDPGRAGIFHVGDQHRTELCRHILKAFSYNNQSLNLVVDG
jgi:hypothetical protein